MSDETPTSCHCCGAEIEAPRRGKRFCSAACRAAHSRTGRKLAARVGSVSNQRGGGTAVTLHFPPGAKARVRELSPGEDIAVEIERGGE